jgi:hypothetical protein
MALFLVSCNKPPGYHEIQWHGQRYYLELAKSCNSLLLDTNHISKSWTIRGDDPSLPKPLLNLHAKKLVITKDAPILIGSTNHVTNVEIFFGKFRPEYVIWWGPTDYGNGYHPWELTAAREVGSKTLFSTTNLSILGTNSAN